MFEDWKFKISTKPREWVDWQWNEGAEPQMKMKQQNMFWLTH